jgi:sigma-B regulation protein RsbQ
MSSVLARNRVTVTGQGTQAIVFTHGLGCDQDDWRHVVPKFERDYKVVRYDLTGFGHSARSAYDVDRYGSLQGHATDLLEIVHELKLGAPYLVGHAAGAMIGALAAIREPQTFARLAMIEASPHYIDAPGYIGGAPRAQIEALLEALERDYFAWCAQAVPSAMGNPDRPQLAAELLLTFRRADPEVAQHFARAVFLSDFRSALPYLYTPTLVVQCPDDVLVPEAVGDYLARVIPDVELITLKTSGHYPQHAGPIELSAALHRWAV